jgi:hypothetical protein
MEGGDGRGSGSGEEKRDSRERGRERDVNECKVEAAAINIHSSHAAMQPDSQTARQPYMQPWPSQLQYST